MSIPVLIVPVLNRPDLLTEMLLSTHHPVERTIIIDNGDVVREPWMHDTYRVLQPGFNLGVAASWNLGIKCTPDAPWWLIANSDLTFGEGDLARLEATVEPGAAALYFMLGMASFALTRHTVNTVGLFDEGFAPAYDEDLDYSRRCDLAGVIKVEAGFTGTHVGSATINSDPILRAANGRTHASNDAYYAAKWGGHKQGGETFSTPFDRGGHIGDWRLESGRLATQSWKKE